MAVLYADERKYKDNAPRQNFVFLGYPFQPPLPKEDYRTAIKELEGEFPVRMWYFLDEVTSLEMMRKIWRAILRSDLSFFDISGGNPNVAFELGLALATEKRAYALFKVGEANPLGAADLGYAERMEYESIATLKEKLRTTLKSKSSAMKLFKEVAYEIFDSNSGLTRDDYESHIIRVVNKVFETKSINRTQARSLVGDRDDLAGPILQTLRSRGVLEMTGAKKHAKYVIGGDWVYKDHEVAGD